MQLLLRNLFTALGVVFVRSLLALLVQKYKY
jgi:hypothetical protein